MSADNYLYVRRLSDGNWTVTMESASDDPRPPRAPYHVYPTWADAYKAAQEWEQREPYPIEYGIHSDPAE